MGIERQFDHLFYCYVGIEICTGRGNGKEIINIF